ncbi:redoxin domain-containing protein [Pedobacter psychrodurus]|uniref:Redoxin domain-containing protein n=1 Tax=Pedobacter psychrodurus TaxID=2530456 RepID=A0A4R0Q5X9_9SPHI|nr:TlpA disulfide reductase family protein [Pedobacter psychrodurus]TCD28589.1 redoxin domain-containing protein [Pedobacter psychrodurus]
MKTIKNLLWTIFICISCGAKAQVKPSFSDRLKLITEEQNPLKNVATLYSAIRDLKLDTVDNAENIDVLKGEVALSYLRKSNDTEFEKYIGLIKNKFNQTSYLNMASERLLKDRSRLNYAEVLAKKTVDLYESYKDQPLARPATFPIEDWNRFMVMAAYPYYQVYAEILRANKKDKQALLYAEKALLNKDPQNVLQSSLDVYTALLVSQGQQEKAYQILLKQASIGKSSLEMKALLRTLTVRKMGNKKASVFLDSIEKNISPSYKTELLKKMHTDTSAPDFTLLNLEGKKVSLSRMIGKVVVLDFWATWCAPCIASMPAMKKISSLHPEVVFLFVATQEQGKDAVSRIKSYIEKSGFPKDTLVDSPSSEQPIQFPVSTAYKVTAIPLKVVIDPKGKIRFKAGGFESDTELMNELETMIYIAKKQ